MAAASSAASLEPRRGAAAAAAPGGASLGGTGVVEAGPGVGKVEGCGVSGGLPAPLPAISVDVDDSHYK